MSQKQEKQRLLQADPRHRRSGYASFKVCYTTAYSINVTVVTGQVQQNSVIV